ncbi:MAG: hypothetical protein HYV60_25810 [Planctomycetia bacterium]|nr:hypothetical protein [Planctomycetia bacterium]
MPTSIGNAGLKLGNLGLHVGLFADMVVMDIYGHAANFYGLPGGDASLRISNDIWDQKFDGLVNGTGQLGLDLYYMSDSQRKQFERDTVTAGLFTTKAVGDCFLVRELDAARGAAWAFGRPHRITANLSPAPSSLETSLSVLAFTGCPAAVGYFGIAAIPKSTRLRVTSCHHRFASPFRHSLIGVAYRAAAVATAGRCGTFTGQGCQSFCKGETTRHLATINPITACQDRQLSAVRLRANASPHSRSWRHRAAET